MEERAPNPRSMGLFGATGVGVGAIVGGGILALAGVAFAATGPAALVAFALNGVIAVLTALSFAEIAAAFPQSGGTYNFAKRFLSVARGVRRRVGGVVRLARRRRALRARLRHVRRARPAGGGARRPGRTRRHWVHAAWTPTLFGVAATLVYSVGLLRRSGGGRTVDQRDQDRGVPRRDRRRRVGVGPYAGRGRHRQPAAVLQPRIRGLCSRRWASPSSRCRASI